MTDSSTDNSGNDQSQTDSSMTDNSSNDDNSTTDNSVADSGNDSSTNPSLRRLRIDAPTNSKSFGLGFVELGARYRLLDKAGLVVSAQGTVRIPGSKRRDVFAQIGQTDAEYDARLQTGVSIGAKAFAIAEAGYRFRNGDPANEFHLDATLGVRPTDKLLLLAQSFNTISDGRGRGFFGKQRFSNAYLSGVYDVGKKVSVQLGVMGTLAGRNALRERGGFAGLWFRF